MSVGVRFSGIEPQKSVLLKVLYGVVQSLQRQQLTKEHERFTFLSEMTPVVCRTGFAPSLIFQQI